MKKNFKDIISDYSFLGEFIKKFIRKYYRLLHKLLNFAQWHVDPWFDRPYSLKVIKMVNNILENDVNMKDAHVAETGCGMGDIISHIKTKNRLGIDIEKSVIRGARLAHPFVHFIQGSFDKVPNNTKILMAVGFLFTIEPDELIRSIDPLLKNKNEIEYIIVDKVPSPPYKFEHDFDKIFGNYGYEAYKKSQGFVAMDARRYILVYRKKR